MQAESTDLEIVCQNGSLLVDSRVLAMRLGYDHKVILQSIRRHKARLEAKSVLLHFEAKPLKGSRGGRPEQYYMLDERQCLILAGSLKKGEEADEWHDHLVDLFLQARERIRELEGQQFTQSKPQFNFKYQERLHLNRNVRIYGYFSVTKFFDDINSQFLEDVVVLSETSSPDISLGRFLASRLPLESWYDAKRVKKPVGGYDKSKWNRDIIMTVYVKDGYEVKREVTHYPLEWHPACWHIVQNEYFAGLFPKYLGGVYKGIVRCADEEMRKYIAERVNYFIDR